MSIEHEIRVLEINKEEIQKRLIDLGAVKVADSMQQRLVYDFTPVDPNKWIRLRNNGNKTTLAIKEILDNTSASGTREIEVDVSNFENMRDILQELGYNARAYQENSRVQYILDGVEICIDSWPLIPTYMEIEAKNQKEVYNMLERLNLNNPKVTTLDVASIYLEIYKIDSLKMKELKF